MRNAYGKAPAGCPLAGVILIPIAICIPSRLYAARTSRRLDNPPTQAAPRNSMAVLEVWFLTLNPSGPGGSVSHQAESGVIAMRHSHVLRAAVCASCLLIS